MHYDRFLSLVVCRRYMLHVVPIYAVIGDFPAMERERATRGTNRGAPRGIPRKTRSHQDSWMLALCCTDLTYWPLQLPCTINRDPARGALATPKERGGEEARKTKKKREGSGRGDVASHVVASRRIFSFPLFLFLSSPGALALFFFIPLAVFVAGVSLFLSFFLSLSLGVSHSLGKARRLLKWEII